MLSFAVIASLALPLLSAAQLVPNAPGPGDVFKQGAQCTISWAADTTGTWKVTNIELMTGPNQQMVHLATVATVDGTDSTKTSVSVPCPGVTPNAPIYFYQFTAQGQNATWTGRFAISDATGATTAPPNAKQPDGSNIPWGNGKLLDSTQGSPPPSTAPAGQIDGSTGAASGSTSNGTASASASSASGSSSSSSSSSVSVATPSSSGYSIISASAPKSSGITTVKAAATTAAAASTTPSAASSTSPNGAITNPRSLVSIFAAAIILGLASLC